MQTAISPIVTTGRAAGRIGVAERDHGARDAFAEAFGDAPGDADGRARRAGGAGAGRPAPATASRRADMTESFVAQTSVVGSPSTGGRDDVHPADVGERRVAAGQAVLGDERALGLVERDDPAVDADPRRRAGPSACRWPRRSACSAERRGGAMSPCGANPVVPGAWIVQPSLLPPT